MKNANLGFEPHHRYAAPITARGSGGDGIFQGVTDLFGTQPGVSGVTLIESLPMGDSAKSETVYRGDIRDGNRVQSNTTSAGAGAMAILATKVLQGRDFDLRDQRGSPRVALVNQTLARRLWPKGGALGDVVWVGGSAHEVVGIVENGKYVSPVEEGLPFVYVPIMQRRGVSSAYVLVRADPAYDADMPQLLSVAASGAAREEYTIGQFSPMQGVVDRWLSPMQSVVTAVRATAVLLVFLVAHGVFRTVGAAVRSSRREIAIRRSLGATRARIIRMMLRPVVTIGFPFAAAGTVLGGAAALALTPLRAGARSDPVVMLGASLCIVVSCAAVMTLVSGILFCDKHPTLIRDLN